MGTQISQATAVTPEQLKQIESNLVDLGERLERKRGDKSDWLVVAQAAALVSGLRHGVVSLPAAGHGA